jgi:Raf kinase inhibitor-like YbhB/YbcL family protein
MPTPRSLSFTALIAIALLAASAAPILGQGAALSVTSAAFADGQPIPLRHSAYGENVSPAISWSGAPAGTQSFVLTVVDTSVPMPGGFVHWLVYNIPATAAGLPEALPADASLTAPPEIAGATQGARGMNQAGYFGPRPPAGPAHDYVVTVYALDAAPNLPAGQNRSQVMEAIEGHILAQGSITGTYQGS